jgi:hypothetical protein
MVSAVRFVFRIKNEAFSNGTVDRSQGHACCLYSGGDTLAPGLCVDDSGDVIKLQNHATGVAMGTYRPIRSNSVR